MSEKLNIRSYRMMSTSAKHFIIFLFFSDILFASNEYRYSEVISQMEELYKNYSAQTRMLSLGKSLEGRPIYALELGESNANKNLYLNAAHHGNELASTQGLIGVLEYLLENQSNPRVKTLLSQFNIVVQPVVNPDGFVRKSRYDSLGRDPNRDYAHPNKTNDNSFQIPAVRLVRDLLSRYKFTGAISFHSGSEGVLFPWCHSEKKNPHHQHFLTLASRTAGAMGHKYFSQSYFDYYTSGEFIDYAYMQYRTLAVTFEVSKAHTLHKNDQEVLIAKSIDGVITFMNTLLDLETLEPAT